MSLELTGKVLEVMEAEQVSATFKKRVIVLEVVEDNPQYAQFIPVEFVQAKTDLLDGFNAGDEVAIKFNPRGRKWVNPQGETRYFPSYQGWAINLIGGHGHQGQGDQPPSFSAPVEVEDAISEEVPF